ncbi:MAG: hypothetical protein ABII12_14710 [Planctomycetota bacterium]
MRCLTDKQIEQLAAGAKDDALDRLRTHVERCEACWRRLQECEVDTLLIGDIRELRERREEVKPLFDNMPETSRDA